jgi:hypothetical protein
MPVLVEKPLTARLDEALEIQKAARIAGSFVMEAMWSRYLPAITKLRVQPFTMAPSAPSASLKRILPGTRLRSRKAASSTSPRAEGCCTISGSIRSRWHGSFSANLFMWTASWRAAPSGVDISRDPAHAFCNAEAEIRCSFEREGSNRLIIEGDKGVMVLAAPFIKAEDFAMYPSRRLADLLEPGGDTLPETLAPKVFTRLPLPGVERHVHGFGGSGLQFEIEAASSAIRLKAE